MSHSAPYKSFFGTLLIVAILVPFFSVPRAAHAVVGVPVQPLPGIITTPHLVTATKTTIESTLTTINTHWSVTKTKILDPAAKFILRAIVRIMKQMVLNYIITGEFGGPRFIANFQVDARLIAENAARSFLSQLTGINFCGFFPRPIPILIPVNFMFQFQCTISSNMYSQFLKDPLTLTEVERFLVMQDPSTNFIQTIISAGRLKAEQIAQASVARTAETLTGSGFLGDAVITISPQDQAAYNAQKTAAGDAAFQQAYGEAIVLGRSIDDATKFGDQARDAAEAAVPKPRGTRTIKTPGQTINSTLNSTILGDTLGPIIADEFDQAVVAIVDTAASVMINKGLSKVFAP